MAEFDDIKKDLKKLREIEAERLRLAKEVQKESAEDREERLDTRAFEALVGELRKDNRIIQKVSKLTETRLVDLTKGPLAKLVKKSGKNLELLEAQLRLDDETKLRAAAVASEREKSKKEDTSVLRGTSRILNTLASNFLDNTQVGQVLGDRMFNSSVLGQQMLMEIGSKALSDRAALKSEVVQLRKNFGDKLSAIGDKFKTFKGFVGKFFTFITDPTKMIKMTAAWFLRAVLVPGLVLLGRGLLAPLKGLDKLVGLFRAGGALSRKRSLKDTEDGGSRKLSLKDTEDEREEKRTKKRQLAFGKTGVLERLGEIRDGILGKKGAGGIFGALKAIIAIAPFILLGVGLLRGGTAGFKEFLKTGDIQKAFGEFFITAFQTFTFGIVDTEEIRDKIKKPFDQMIDAFRDGFSVKGLFEFTAGAGKFVAGIPDLAFKLGTGIVSLTSRLLGFDEFADEVTALFKDFNLFDSIVGGITAAQNSLLHFFTGTTAAIATGIAGLDVNVTAAKIAKITEKAALDTALEEMLIARSEQDKQIRQLRRLGRNKQADKAQLQFDKILANVQTLRKRQKEIAEEALEHEETVLEQVERGKQEKAGLAAAMTKEADAAAGVHKSFLQRAIEGAQSAQDAGSELFAAAAQGLSNVIKDPDIASGKNLQALFSTNTDLRDKARAAITVAPITNTTVTPPAGGTAIMSPPMSLRNPENTLQRVRDKDHGAAVN